MNANRNTSHCIYIEQFFTSISTCQCDDGKLKKTNAHIKRERDGERESHIQPDASDEVIKANNNSSGIGSDNISLENGEAALKCTDCDTKLLLILSIGWWRM